MGVVRLRETCLDNSPHHPFSRHYMGTRLGWRQRLCRPKVALLIHGSVVASRLTSYSLVLAASIGGICVRIVCRESSVPGFPLGSPAVPSVAASASRTGSFREGDLDFAGAIHFRACESTRLPCAAEFLPRLNRCDGRRSRCKGSCNSGEAASGRGVHKAETRGATNCWLWVSRELRIASGLRFIEYSQRTTT
jgi:hypothetical protein